MAAPHVTALAGILRSASPLQSRATIETTIRNSSVFPDGSQWQQNDEYGHGMPRADIALNATLPSWPPNNRLTPLFSFYSQSRKDYFYSTAPQMGWAATQGLLLPQGGNGTPTNYLSEGNPVYEMPRFPGSEPYDAYPAYTGYARAQVWIFTTPENPIYPQLTLVPLYRLSYACNHPQYSNASSPAACAANPNNTDTTYTPERAGITAFTNIGYRLDGVEGYIYPKNLVPPPAGTVRLIRKYNAERDDHAIFPETELTTMMNLGYTGSSGSDWLVYVYPNSGYRPWIW